MRWETAYTTDGGQAYAATPHYEDWVWDFWPFSGHHCVRPGYFDSGKTAAVNLWYANNKHPDLYYSNWGNTFAPLKCDGQYVGGNGIVVYVNVVGNDAY